MSARKTISVLEAMQAHVRDAVLWYRTHGYQRTDAMSAVCADLGLTPWQTKALFYRDGLWKVSSDAYGRLIRRWGQHLDARMAELTRQAEEIRVAQRQYSLDIGESEECPNGGGTHSQR